MDRTGFVSHTAARAFFAEHIDRVIHNLGINIVQIVENRQQHGLVCGLVAFSKLREFSDVHLWAFQSRGGN